jgi:KaiC/GvpD/RAD55 family RecA-like ATPase
VMYTSPVELQVDRIIVSLFQRIELLGIRRVVIDAVGDLVAAASDTHRLHDYIYALVQHFTVKGVTSILTCETASRLSESTGATTDVGGSFSYMSDNIILLSTDVKSPTGRSLTVLKSRASRHDLGSHDMSITDKGIHLQESPAP